MAMSRHCLDFPFGIPGCRDIENVMLRHQLDVAAFSRHFFEVSPSIALVSLQCRDIDTLMSRHLSYVVHLLM